MSRTVINLICNKPEKSEIVIKKILKQYNYELKEKNGEEYYQCGVGILTAPKFIKYSFDGNNLRLEGWVRAFAFGGESDLNGFLAAVPKKSCKKTLEDIQNNMKGVHVNNDIQNHHRREKSHFGNYIGSYFCFFNSYCRNYFWNIFNDTQRK